MNIRTSRFGLVPILAGVACALAVACSMDDDEPGDQDCGDDRFKQLVRSSSDLLANDGHFVEATVGNVRTYTWRDSYSQVCTKAENATEAHFTIEYAPGEVGSGTRTSIQAEGNVYQSGFIQPYRTTLRSTADATRDTGTVAHIGLQQAWGDGPGEMQVELVIRKPIAGTAEDDRASLIRVIKSLRFDVDYYDYIAPRDN